jgi:hypothetical protein
MKYWKEATKEEVKGREDESVFIDSLLYLPIELRGPDELTDEERDKLHSVYCNTPWDGHKRTDIIELIKLSDELRARPRESEKEKWIREYMEKQKINQMNGGDVIRRFLEKTWDAATEVERRKHE